MPALQLWLHSRRTPKMQCGTTTAASPVALGGLLICFSLQCSQRGAALSAASLLTARGASHLQKPLILRLPQLHLLKH